MPAGLSLILQSTSGLISLFFLLFASSWITIPAMGALLVSYGASASNIPTLITIIIIAYFASILGDITIYLLTSKFSNKALKLLKRFEFYQKNNRESRALLKKYGFWVVFLSRFTLTEICLVMNYIAGFAKFDKRKFITAVLLGELVYSIGFACFGYTFKDTWNYLLGLVEDSIWGILIVVIVYFIIRKIIRMVKKKKARIKKDL